MKYWIYTAPGGKKVNIDPRRFRWDFGLSRWELYSVASQQWVALAWRELKDVAIPGPMTLDEMTIDKLEYGKQ